MIKNIIKKRSDGDLAIIWDIFTCWLMPVLKRLFLERRLSKIFRVCNFGNTLTITIILLFKMFKIWWRFQKCNKNLEKLFRFSDYCIWSGSCNFSQTWTVYFPSTVNVLANSPKISPNTRGDIFLINFPENDKKHDKNALVGILEGFGTLSHVDGQFLFSNGVI